MLITFNILTYDKIIQFEQTLVTQIRAQNTSQVVYMSSSFWLLDHVIYLKLRKKELFTKLDKF